MIKVKGAHILESDLFAVYTLGPAYAWSHLHLSATRGEDPYKVPTMGGASTHPADGARMDALLHGLTLTGFAREAAEIEDRWKELMTAAGAAPDADYRRCFPKQIIETIAEKALAGVRAMGCRVAEPGVTSPVHDLLNLAWTEFWRNPAGYAAREKELVEELRRVCASV